MWPFGSNRISEEDKARLSRKCSLALHTLRQCRAANAGEGIASCDNLETQVVYCNAEVLCPELAAAHQRCFRQAVNSKGKIPYSACDKHIVAMKKCLAKRGLHPFK